jgi:hypothetical protein
MNNINIEKNLSCIYRLHTCNVNGKKLIELSLDNVARVEAILRLDSNYKKSLDPTAKPQVSIHRHDIKDKKTGRIKFRKGTHYYGYGGSTAFWMKKLKDVLDKKLPKAKIKNIIYKTVSAVDRDNSTHLTADKVTGHSYGDGRCELTDRLLKKSSTLVDLLYKRQFSIINELSMKTNKGKGRENYSFATKFCHYACFYWFEGTPQADNYSIYDNVLAKTLADYANAYKIYQSFNKNVKYNEKSFEKYEDYKMYSDVIDALRRKSVFHISRNGLDHLLWYANK